MNSWLAVENTVGLWAFLLGSATVAILIEQRYRWSAKIPGAVIALFIALLASNFNLVPKDAPVFDAVWSYVVPFAIPLLLFQVNIRSIFRESRRLLFIFLMSSLGTMMGAVVAFFLFRDAIPELDKVSGMISASYIGGGVNFAAMTAKLAPSQDIIASTIVADNLIMALYFIVLLAVASIGSIRRFYGSPHMDGVEQEASKQKGATLAEAYWQPKAISLRDIAINIAASMLLVAISFKLSDLLQPLHQYKTNIILEIFIGLMTDKYLILTTLTFVALFLFESQFKKLEGSQELGTYAIYIFFVVIGLPASIPLILQNAPLLLLFVVLIMLVNLGVTLFFGKLFKFTIEEIVLACNANVGGPTTAAAMAIGSGWRNLVGPILVVGTVGYVLGNYAGTIIQILLAKFM